MKNKYFTLKLLLAILIVCMVLLTGRYYQHKMVIISSDGASEKDKPNTTKPTTTKPKESSSTTTKPLSTTKPTNSTKPASGNEGGTSVVDYGIKKPTTFKSFDELAMRDVNTMFVFGRTGCVYCEKYYPVLEEVSKEKKIEIVYVNLANFNEEDYLAVLNSDITILGKCVNDGVNKKLSDGFGTPLTLFINKYSTYDCIRGYKDKNDLENILKKIGYIK